MVQSAPFGRKCKTKAKQKIGRLQCYNWLLQVVIIGFIVTVDRTFEREIIFEDWLPGAVQHAGNSSYNIIYHILHQNVIETARES